MLKCWFWLCLAAAPAALLAQGSGVISGSIQDASGGAVPNARVRITETATRSVRSLTTNETGYYSSGSLPPGSYVVEVEADGFQKYIQRGVRLQVDERLRVDASLRLGSLTESIEVTASGVAVNTQDAVIRSVVDAKRMVDLPLNGRSPLQLMLLAPGVLPSPADGIGGSFQPGGQQFVTASGSRGNGINYVLDGGDNMDTYRSVANSFPNPDILLEFSVQTNSYSSEFGGRAGGVVNAVTKSGTNQLHGTAFEFLRNYNLNARNFFASGDDGLKRHQFGGTLGGPVVLPHLYNGKDRTFFFFGIQQTYVRQRPNTVSSRVFTAQQRGGDFSDLVDGRGNQIVIRDPDTREPFPNNRIPANRLDPVFQKFLAIVPTAQESNGLVRYPVLNQDDDTQYNIRVDHQITSNDRIFGRLFKDNALTPNSGFEGNILSYRNSLSQRATHVTLNYSKVISPTTMAEFSTSLNRSAGLRQAVTPVTWREFGSNIPSAGATKDLRLAMTGYFSLALFGDTPLVRNNFQYKGTVGWMLGRHNLRTGIDVIRRQYNVPIVNVQFHGLFTFSRALTGDSGADAILGRPSEFTQDTGWQVAVRETDWVGWVNDEIKLNRRTTLTLGARYEPFLPWHDTWADIPQVAQYIPGRRSTVYRNAPAGLLFYGDPDVPKGMAANQYMRFAPRVGLAIDPFGDGKSSVRAGYGVFYDTLLPTEQIQQYASQIPAFTVVAAFSNPPSTLDPYAGRPVPFPAQVPRERDFVFGKPVNNQIRMYDNSFTNPYTQQWNLSVERQVFGPATVARISYQGSKGTRLPIRVESNPATYIPGQSTRANVDQRRPAWPDYSSIRTVTSVGSSTYNALVASVEKRFSRGFSLIASYTWSKNIDTGENVGSANGAVINSPYDYFSDRGPSAADRTHGFVLSYVWDLPRLQNANPVVRALFGNWQSNGILRAYTSTPFTIVAGIDNSLAGTGADRADLVGNPALDSGRSRGEQIQRYFNTAAFAPNAPNTFGTSGRNNMRGPNEASFDTSLMKTIPIVERHSIQFRAEFFNLTNRVNLGNPVSSLQAANFGRITSAGSPRILQFALRYTF